MKILMGVENEKTEFCKAVESMGFSLECAIYDDFTLKFVESISCDVVILEENTTRELTQNLCVELSKTLKVPILIWLKNNDVSASDYYKYGATDLLYKHNEKDVMMKLLVMAPMVCSKEVQPMDCLTIDESSRRVYVSGQEVRFANREFELLKFLKDSPDKVFNKVELYDLLWQEENFGDYVTVAVHIRRIRKKLMHVSEHEYIETVRGAGYRYVMKST